MDVLAASTGKAVREAGKLFLDNIDESMIIQKGAKNFVTQIDFRVQDFLICELDRIIPGANIITEESNHNRFDLEKPTWILDPVDGTTNLMHDFRHSAVSLALFIDKNPVLAYVYNPYAEEMFYGEAGNGAFLNGKRMRASSTAILEESLIGFGTAPYDRSKAGKTFSIVEKIFLKCQEIRRSGSAALDLAYVACGRMDGFFEMTLQPWDYAAGMLILQEAGGRITNWDGNCPALLKSDSIAASNSLVHDALLEVISEVNNLQAI